MADQPKTYKALTDDELIDMHNTLRAQFELAGRMTTRWKDAGYYNEANTSDPDKLLKGYAVLAPAAQILSTTAQALLAVDKELQEREARQLRKKPLTP